MRAALNAATREMLRPISMGLGLLYAILAISYLLALPNTLAPVLAGAAEATAVSLFLFYLYLCRFKLSEKWVQPAAASLAGLVLINSLLHIYLAADLQPTGLIVLLMFGAGLLFLSSAWLAAFLLVSISAWSLVIWITPISQNWLYSVFSLLAAGLLSILVYNAHLHTRRRIETLRIQNARHKTELEAVLVSTEEAQRSLATSMAIGQRITSILDLDVLLNQVADLIKERIRGDFVGIFLLDEGKEYVIARAGTGETGQVLAREGFRLKVGEQGVIGWVAEKHRPARVDDVLSDERYFSLEALPDTRSELALPLEMGRTLLGVLDIQSNRPAAFREEDVPFMQMLADQAAIAIQNARLYNQVTRFNQDLEQRVQQRTEALQAAYDQLERLDQTKSDFISIASHELRTPITVINGYCQMLLEDTGIKQNTLYQQLVTGIHNGADRLNEIVGSLLDTAKIDSRALQLHPGPVFISNIVEFVSSGLETAFEERKQTLVVEKLNNLPSIQGDPEALRKVFYHLMVNAIKFTPDNGVITIAGRYLSSDRHSPEDSAVEVIVSDTGIGIDPGMQELIFEKFYQTGEVAVHSTGKIKFKGGGPGLGLAIARGIVMAHGGRIWAESRGYDEVECPGSHFHIVLPVHQ